jgi:hypothetical protein
MAARCASALEFSTPKRRSISSPLLFEIYPMSIFDISSKLKNQENARINENK